MKIEVTSENQDISNELKACLGLEDVILTLGGIMLLIESKSPYIYGGTVDGAAIATAQEDETPPIFSPPYGGGVGEKTRDRVCSILP